MSTRIGNIECYREFSDEFSKQYVPEFRKVFDFYKAHAVDKESIIRKLHLGYTAMRPEAFDFVASSFPWLEEFRIKYGLTKKLNFLETHGIEKPEFRLHIDGKPGDPAVMFNVPIYNCTHETTTYWVMPDAEFTPVYSCENGTRIDTKSGATPHLPADTEYIVIQEHSFINNAALFRSDIYHGVKNNTRRDEFRIMMHWWFPQGETWDSALERFGL